MSYIKHEKLFKFEYSDFVYPKITTLDKVTIDSNNASLISTFFQDQIRNLLENQDLDSQINFKAFLNTDTVQSIECKMELEHLE